MPVHLAPLTPATLAAARALLAAEGWRHGYAERPLELLEAVAEGSAEYRVDVATDGDRVLGVVVSGLVAGASGAGVLYGVGVDAAARRRGVGRRLVALARERLRAEGARATFAEVPDDAGAVGDVLGLLAAMGFREEGRVADFYRDAVALLILRG